MKEQLSWPDETGFSDSILFVYLVKEELDSMIEVHKERQEPGTLTVLDRLSNSTMALVTGFSDSIYFLPRKIRT